MKKAIKPLALATAVSAALLSGQALAYEQGDWVVRAGATLVEPDEDSGNLAFNGSVSGFNNAIEASSSSGLSVDSSTQLGLTFEYMLTDNWGIELLAATPFEHTASGTGALSGLEIADAKQLPPTLMGIYHFNANEQWQPYVGLGLNYTIFFQEDTTHAADATLATLGLTNPDVEIDDSWGLSAQAGVDYHVDEQWHVNASVRWVDIDTDVEVTFDGGHKITTDLDVDPLVYSIMVGYTF